MNTFTSSTPSALSVSSVGPGLANSWDCASKIVSSGCVLAAWRRRRALTPAAAAGDEQRGADRERRRDRPDAADAVRGNRVAMGARIRLNS